MWGDAGIIQFFAFILYIEKESEFGKSSYICSISNIILRIS